MTHRVAAVLLLVCIVPLACVNTHGNRREGRPMVTRTSEIRRFVGKDVTLVGTARAGDLEGAYIELMGGNVKLPAFTWPEGYVGSRVTVSGTVIDVDRVGEIESTSKWSR
jgi:hypothetical protein